MPTTSNPSITLTDVGLQWRDGTTALSGISGSFGPFRSGLVGSNGAGKSTLLRLMAGVLTPTQGHIRTNGDVGYLPQTLTLSAGSALAELLGIGNKLTALRAIESGDVGVEHFDVLGDDWDIETKADEALHHIGFSGADLDRKVGEISGGEAMLVAITGLRLQRTSITLLDEPTNNLDREACTKLYELLATWPGTLVVVSHDVDLLESMDATAELHAGQLTVWWPLQCMAILLGRAARRGSPSCPGRQAKHEGGKAPTPGSGIEARKKGQDGASELRQQERLEDSDESEGIRCPGLCGEVAFGLGRQGGRSPSRP